MSGTENLMPQNTLRVACILFLHLISVPVAQAAWARVPIAGYSDETLGAAYGLIDGRPTLVAAHGQRLGFLSWKGDQWAAESFPLRNNSKISIVVMDGRGDGVNRVYVGFFNEPLIFELVRTKGHWYSETVNVPGIGTDYLRSGNVGRDMKTPLLAYRGLGPTTSNPQVWAEWRNPKRHDCQWDGSTWRCVAHESSDPILPAPIYEFPGGRPREFSPGNLVSSVQGRLRDDKKDRTYQGAEDGHIYESEEFNGQFETTALGSAKGIARHLFIGDLRLDGRNHLYAFEGRTAITEYTYYQNKTVVAVLPFSVADSTWTAVTGAGRALANAFRTELTQFDHLVVVETENVDKVLGENQFRKARCYDAACAKEVGALLKARATVSGRVTRGEKGVTIVIEVYDNKTGRLLIDAKLENTPETNVVNSLKKLSEICAIRWPHL